MKTSTWVMIASIVVIVFIIGLAVGLWALPVAAPAATTSAATAVRCFSSSLAAGFKAAPAFALAA